MRLIRCSLVVLSSVVICCPVAPAQDARPSAAAPVSASPAAAHASADPPADFLAADVHETPYSFFSTYFRVAPLVGDRFVARHAALLDLITMAYKVEPDAVAGGPPGLEFDNYDIIAKTPPGTTSQGTPAMLQALLADRFNLVVKTETKPLPAFLLTSGKGSDEDEAGRG